MRIFRLIAAAGLLSAALAAQADSIVLECEHLLDVESGKLLEGQQVLVADQRIAAVGAAVEAGPEVARIPLRTCLPGLMDMHVHLAEQSAPNGYIRRFQLNPADYALTAAHYAGITLRAGFTTVRNLGDPWDVTIALRNAIEAGQAAGPRIFSAGKAIGTTGGHADPTNGYRADLMGDPGPAAGVINGPDEARQAVRQRYKTGADLIKITATGGVMSLAVNSQNPQFTSEEIEAIIATAQDYGMHVAAHAHGAEGMKRAIRAGVHSIEHGTYMDDEVIALLKQHGTYYVPTISAGKFVAEKSAVEGYFPAVVRPKAAAVGPQIQETFARAWKAGVTIAFGTDAGVGPHGENAKEFAYMVEGGMPPLAAIRSATLTAAQLLGKEAELGSIAAGKRADVIAVDGNPLDDIGLLQQVRFVMKDGVVYRQD